MHFGIIWDTAYPKALISARMDNQIMTLVIQHIDCRKTESGRRKEGGRRKFCFHYVEIHGKIFVYLILSGEVPVLEKTGRRSKCRVAPVL